MKPRPILAGILALFVLQTLPAANNTPVFSALGKILFPATSPAASISASSGALTMAAGGTDQNVILTPTGTGIVLANSPLRSSTSGSIGIQSVNTAAPGAGSGGALYGQVSTAPSAADQRLGLTIFGMLDSTLRNAAAIAGWSNEAWTPGTAQGSYLTLEATANGTASRTSVARVYSNGVSVLTGAAPAYAVDVTGDINASGVYRVGGAAGQTTTILNVLRGAPAAGQSNCSLIFTGGIRTGGTC
jgi:hypothetical protein